LSALNNFEFLNIFKGTEWTSHLKSSEFSNALKERSKPQVDDIYYSTNELHRLSNQGIDVSNFLVANGIDSGKKRIGKKSRLISIFTGIIHFRPKIKLFKIYYSKGNPRRQ